MTDEELFDAVDECDRAMADLRREIEAFNRYLRIRIFIMKIVTAAYIFGAIIFIVYTILVT